MYFYFFSGIWKQRRKTLALTYWGKEPSLVHEAKERLHDVVGLSEFEDGKKQFFPLKSATRNSISQLGIAWIQNSSIMKYSSCFITHLYLMRWKFCWLLEQDLISNSLFRFNSCKTFWQYTRGWSTSVTRNGSVTFMLILWMNSQQKISRKHYLLAISRGK